MTPTTYGKLVNGEIEYNSTPAQQIVVAPKVVDSWHGIPLIMDAIDLYADMKLVGVLNTGALLIEYQHIQYRIADNGGEITIQKINDPKYFAEFPTVYFSSSLNSETLMYRLLQTLKGEPIDYKFRETEFHHIAKAS